MVLEGSSTTPIKIHPIFSPPFFKHQVVVLMIGPSIQDYYHMYIYIYTYIYMEVSQVMGVPLVIHFFIGCSMKPTSQLGIPISPSCAYRPASTPWRMQRATAASSWTNTLLPSGQGEAKQGQMPRATAGDLVVCTYSIIYIYIIYIYILYIYDIYIYTHSYIYNIHNRT